MNVEVPSGLAIRVTAVPVLKLALHASPQVMPGGLDVTVPPPAPVLVTLRVYWMISKLALTDFAVSMASWHTSGPLHAPDQPVNTDVASAVAVSVTTVSAMKSA